MGKKEIQALTPVLPWKMRFSKAVSCPSLNSQSAFVRIRGLHQQGQRNAQKKDVLFRRSLGPKPGNKTYNMDLIILFCFSWNGSCAYRQDSSLVFEREIWVFEKRQTWWPSFQSMTMMCQHLLEVSWLARTVALESLGRKYKLCIILPELKRDRLRWNWGMQQIHLKIRI